MTPAGPDVTNLPASLQAEFEAPVNLSATINDMRFSNLNGAEPTQNIVTAQYYIDTPPWVTSPSPVAYPMAAADGTFNSKSEGVIASINTIGLNAGKHIIFVRGQDVAGNWGAVSAVFLNINAPAYTMSLTPADSLRGGNAGETITHTVWLTNTGPSADIYTFTLTSNWDAAIFTADGNLVPPNSQLPLGNGQGVQLNVAIYPPAQAALGDRDTATLTITSQGLPTLSRTSDLISVIWRYFFYPFLNRD